MGVLKCVGVCCVYECVGEWVTLCGCDGVRVGVGWDYRRVCDRASACARAGGRARACVGSSRPSVGACAEVCVCVRERESVCVCVPQRLVWV